MKPRSYYFVGCEVWVCIGDTRGVCKFELVTTAASEAAAEALALRLNND